ncbi:MAG: hypothetical protein K0S55_1470 [Clostridia bacterium]|nr:hypothetical protein [Clostridia bacterium]
MSDYYTQDEITYLRRLAAGVKTISIQTHHEKNRRRWFNHNSLKGDKPMVFVHPDGSWDELLPYNSLQCKSWLARDIEYQLRRKLIRREYIHDDVPVIGEIRINKHINNSMWGVTPKIRPSSDRRGAWHHEAVISKPSDWNMLKMPVVEYNEQGTMQAYNDSCEVFKDILPVRLVGVTNFSFHLLHWYCDYRGINNLMTDLYDEPEMIHERMQFFVEGIKSMLSQYEKLNLLSLNNDDTFFYTGGIGYTNELPVAGFNPERVRLCDLWGSAEAQEFSCVSPEMHEDFVLQYEREILKPFGLTGYGCCDDLAKKLDGVLKIHNIRRIAACPWSDIANFAPVLKDKYIITWKPQPSHLAAENIDEDLIYKELAEGIRKAKGCHLELILRDTHTCRNDPSRFTKWIELARKAIASES